MAELDNVYELEESMDINLNLEKFSMNNTQQQISLCESFPISTNYNNPNNAQWIKDLKAETQTGDGEANFRIEESYPIVYNNFQGINPSIVTGQTEKNCQSNLLSTASTQQEMSEHRAKNTNTKQNNQQQQNAKQGQTIFLNSVSISKAKPQNQQQQLCNSEGEIKEAQKVQGQSLDQTQVIIEKDKYQMGDDIPSYNFEPDIISNTYQKKKNQVQCFELKSVHQKKFEYVKMMFDNGGKQNVVIGRQKRASKTDIQIDDSSVSSQHARISWDSTKQSWFLQDEKSTNGTYLILQNSLIKEGDTLLIGLHYVRILKIKKSFPIQIELEFENAAEEEPPFKITCPLEMGGKIMIGKKYQKFENDEFIEPEHCYIFYDNSRIKIQNCENVEYKAAKKLGDTQVSLNEKSIIRFGLINQFSFTPFTKQLKADNEKDQTESQPFPLCVSCKSPTKTPYYFQPCLHNNFCLVCARQAIKCPVCGVKIIDFECKEDANRA